MLLNRHLKHPSSDSKKDRNLVELDAKYGCVGLCCCGMFNYRFDGKDTLSLKHRRRDNS